MRRICVITSTRADYGLLRWVMQAIKDDSQLELQIIATGMHLSPEFGLTYKEMVQDGFEIDRNVEILVSSDTAIGVTKAMGLGLIGFADVFNELKPDLILVLGDRFEIFSAVSAAFVAGLPIAHIHGGEVTEGVLDDTFRHCITKMSHFHLVATDVYRQRVIQLGEHPDNVYLVGGLGVEGRKRTKLLDRVSLETSLDFKLAEKNLLVTFHPATLDGDLCEMQMQELLRALEKLDNTHLIFTLPNADTKSRAMIELIYAFVAKHSFARAYTSLGQERYLSCIAHVDGVVGNSSSGLLEAPSLKTGAINIGDRQRGRLQADSIINCDPTEGSISLALSNLYSDEYQMRLAATKNPYDQGCSSENIVRILKKVVLDKNLKKTFYDMPAHNRK